MVIRICSASWWQSNEWPISNPYGFWYALCECVGACVMCKCNAKSHTFKGMECEITIIFAECCVFFSFVVKVPTSIKDRENNIAFFFTYNNNYNNCQKKTTIFIELLNYYLFFCCKEYFVHTLSNEQKKKIKKRYIQQTYTTISQNSENKQLRIEFGILLKSTRKRAIFFSTQQQILFGLAPNSEEIIQR